MRIDQDHPNAGSVRPVQQSGDQGVSAQSGGSDAVHEPARAEKEVASRWYNLDFSTAVSRRYCELRRGFLERMSKLCLFVNIGGGTAAFSAFFLQQPQWGAWAGGVVAIGGLLDLCCRFEQGAQQQDQQYRRYTTLLRDIKSTERPNAEDLREFTFRYHDIESDDGNPRGVLTMMCFNAECLARDSAGDGMAQIGLFRRVLANIIDLPAPYWRPMKIAAKSVS